MAAIRLRPAARADLKAIAAFTERRWAPDQRDHYLERLNTCFRRLTENPEVGVQRDAVMPGLRSVLEGRHVVFYRTTEDGIVVIRVLHVNMDVAQHLGGLQPPDGDR